MAASELFLMNPVSVVAMVLVPPMTSAHVIMATTVTDVKLGVAIAML